MIGLIEHINPHGMRLMEAEFFICDKILESFCLEREGVRIVHGFNRGTAIRNFVRKGSLLKHLRKHYPEVGSVSMTRKDPGVTYVFFNT